MAATYFGVGLSRGLLGACLWDRGGGKLVAGELVPCQGSFQKPASSWCPLAAPEPQGRDAEAFLESGG